MYSPCADTGNVAGEFLFQLGAPVTDVKAALRLQLLRRSSPVAGSIQREYRGRVYERCDLRAGLCCFSSSANG